jgi:hypothetical protein
MRRVRTAVKTAVVLTVALLPIIAQSPAHAAEWQFGDVIAAVGDGKYEVYSNSGALKESFGVGSGFTAGCAFDAPGAGQNLYTTYFSEGNVKKYSRTHPHGLLQTITTGFASPESIVFAANGHFFVGHADAPSAEIVEYDASGNQIDVDPVAREDRGSDWIELSADQRTMFYTSEGRTIHRFDVVSDMQLPNFATLPGFGDFAFALRLLPPGDGSGGLLVGDTSNVKRLDAAGNVLQTYDAPGEDFWFALNLDPNGTSFWSAGLESTNFYRFNISTGAVEVGPVTTGAQPGALGGLCLLGETTAAIDTRRPSCSVVSRSANEIVLRLQDVESGLREITASDVQNATVTIPSFTPGTNDPVDVTAMKTDPSMLARFRIEAFDIQGNVTRCTSRGVVIF